jgi:hypothetical protein
LNRFILKLGEIRRGILPCLKLACRDGEVLCAQKEEWTRSIAVGSRPFVERVKNLLGIRAKGREVIEGAKGYQLREETASYQALFQVENRDIGLDNATLLDINA